MLKVVQNQTAPLFTIDELGLIAQSLGGQCKGFKLAQHIAQLQEDNDGVQRADRKLEMHDGLVNKFCIYLMQSHGAKVARLFTEKYERSCQEPLFEMPNG